MNGSPTGLDHTLMTLRQAADKTGLSATTLRRYIKAGRLRARLIPGRYGPEYVVDDEALAAARLLAEGTAHDAGAVAAMDAPVPTLAAPPPGADVVPSMLFRELLMKHEQLLVQYGMLRVGGQQLFELRHDLQRRADDARRTTEELELLRDRHAREIGQLKAKLRQSELEIAHRDDQIRQLKRDQQRLEIGQRNAARLNAIDTQFARSVQPPPLDASGGSTEH